MKISKLAMAAALSFLLLGRGAVADEPTSSNESQTRTVTYSLTDDNPTSLVSYVTHGDSCDCDSGCDDCCDGCGPCCYPLADLGEACKLFDGCFFQERGIEAG